MKKRTVIATSTTIVLLAAVLNYNWVHAAVVHGVAAESCDSALLEEARERVAGLFGETRSQPWVTCLSEPTLGLGKIIGTANFAPLLPTVITLAPHGQNVDVTAHEWAHAELTTRAGLLYRLRMPTWFDEGLAMQVDHRPEYGEAALVAFNADAELTRPDPSSLATAGGFFHPSNQGMYHYAFARCLVGRWLEHNPASTEWPATDALNAFAAAEAAACTQAPLRAGTTQKASAPL